MANKVAHETAKLLENKDEISNMGAINNTVLDNQLYEDDSSSANITDYLHFFYASMFFCMATFFQQSVSPITDVLQSELNVSLSGIGILSSSYFLTYLLCQIPFGILLQKYSHHSILLTVSISLTLCFILFGFIQNLMFASILRVIGGAFGAPTWLITVTLVGEHFGNNEVQFFGAITTLFAFIITFIALTVQGYIYEYYGVWRDTYYILGLIGGVNVIAIIATMFIQHRKPKSIHKYIHNADTKNTGSILIQPEVTTCTQHSELLADELEEEGHKLGTALSNYQNWFLGLYGFAQYTVFSAIFGLWLIPYLMIKFDYTRSKAAFAAGMGTASGGVGTLLFGYIASKYRKRKIYLFVADLLMASLFIILYFEYINEYVVFIFIITSGLGVGSVNILFTLVREYNASRACEETATVLFYIF